MDPADLSRDQLVAQLNRLREKLTRRDLAPQGWPVGTDAGEVFRRLVENANDIVYALTPDGRFLYVSPNWTEILGHDTSEVVGQVFVPFVHPDDVPACLAFLQRVFETGEKQSGIEYRVKHKAGGYRWHTSNAFLLETLDGEIIYGGIAHDITARKQLEEQLASRQAELERLLEQASDNHAVLQAILDVSPNALMLVDTSGTITVTNRYLTLFFGSDVTDGDALSISSFVERIAGCFEQPDAFVALAERLSAQTREATARAACCSDAFAIDPHQLMARAMRLVRPQGRDVALVITPTFDARGERAGDLWVFADLTRFKAAEQQLHSIVEASPVPLIITRVADGEILFANQPLAQLVGSTTEALVGQKTPDFYARPEGRDEVLAHLSKNGQLRSHEVQLKRLDGSTFWALLSIVLTDVNGEPAVLGGVLDIDDRRRMEDALRNALAELEQANSDLRQAQAQLVQSEKMASLGLLVAGVAHEINTPLGAISSMHDTQARALDKLEALDGTASVERRQRLYGAIREANRVIGRGIGRVAEIVARLRSFARLDEAELKRVDLHRCIDDTLALIEHDIRGRIRVVRQLGELPKVACYPGRLNQVFLNILLNAVQSIVGEGQITVTTRVDDDGEHVSVAIADSGRGINAEHLPKVFDPGFTTKGVGVGTGLGLSICYKIVEEHDGRIAVQSEPGKGSTFTVVLPLDLDRRP